jgi:hypothetical protein
MCYVLIETNDGSTFVMGRVVELRKSADPLKPEVKTLIQFEFNW